MNKFDLLDVRRLQNDVTMMYKILHGRVSIDLNNCLPVSNNTVTIQ